METQSSLTPTIPNELLFDDRSLLEQALGKEALNIVSINANCDCSAYYSTEDDDAIDPQKIAQSALTIH